MLKRRKVDAGHYRLAVSQIGAGDTEAIVARRIAGRDWFAWCPAWHNDRIFNTMREGIAAIEREYENA